LEPRGVPDLDDLTRSRRCKTQLRSGERIDPPRIDQRGTLNSQGVIPFHLLSLLPLKLLDQVTVPDALKMLPGKKHDEKKDEGSQDKQAETLPAFLAINLTLQAGIIDPLNKIDFWIRSASCDRLVPRTALRTGKTHCNCSHDPLLSNRGVPS
jgi:hypothetical protein